MFRWMNAMDFIIWDIWFSHEYDRRINCKRELKWKNKRRKREEKENRTGTGHVLENVSDPDDNGVHCKSDRNNL